MLDQLVPLIEEAAAQGAIVLLKWDGERTSKRGTVVITRRDTDYVWRKDTDDIDGTLAEGLAEYRARHAQ
jgi:hypothetical protein